jgi:hypothetical protein
MIESETMIHQRDSASDIEFLLQCIAGLLQERVQMGARLMSAHASAQRYADLDADARNELSKISRMLNGACTGHAGSVAHRVQVELTTLRTPRHEMFPRLYSTEFVPRLTPPDDGYPPC